jgi:ABC-2 type transport system ATP-binding protein
MDAGVVIRSFTTTKISLEDIFIRVYGDQNTPPRPVTASVGTRAGA